MVKMGRPIYEITLSEVEQKFLESLMRSRTEQAQIVQRARILLLLLLSTQKWSTPTGRKTVHLDRA